MAETVNVFIGLDEPHKIAYDVCKQSILTGNKKYKLNIRPINYNTAKGYKRKKNKNESTQFSFARFWVPYESNFEGISIFLDSDFLFLKSIDDLIDLYDPKKAVMCCKHDYTPTSALKMDGKIQTTYPRKNWSSLIIFNNSHKKNKTLEPWLLNSLTGAYLHRFMWLADRDMGSLPLEWNWLVNWYKEEPGFAPKALHFTEGGPWLDGYENCQYNELWRSVLDEIS